jgi:uncharacterized protein YggE
MARARLYAEAAGLKIARVAEIREGGRRPEYAMTRSGFAAGAATPVAAGEVDLTAKIEVVIELE